MNSVIAGQSMAQWWVTVALVAATRSRAQARSAGSHGLRRRAAQPDPARATALFVQAVCVNSSDAQDWLRLASQVLREHEIRYCLERALALDPASTRARQALAQLPDPPEYIQQMTGHLSRPC